MNRSRRIALCGLVAAALVVAVAAGAAVTPTKATSSAQSHNATKTLEIALFGYAAANSYTQSIFKGAQQQAKTMNAKVTFFDGKFDAAVQLRQMQNAIVSKKFDIFLLTPNDPVGVVPAVKEAIGKGITVGVANTNIGPRPSDNDLQVPGLSTRVMFDIKDGAKIFADRMALLCKGKNPCNAVLLWGVRSLSFEAARRSALLNSLKRYPSIKVVGEGDGKFLRDESYKVSQNILQAHSDVNLIVSPSGDQMILGAEQALHDKGLNVGGKSGVQLIGLGGSTAAVSRVKSGVWNATFVQAPLTMGKLTTKFLVNAHNKQKYSAFFDMNKVFPQCGALVDKKFLSRCSWFKGEWTG
jgi:ribose transport system substrate-binding protein